MVRTYVSDVLTANGYTVLSAETGVEALAMCDTYAGPIHLLLTDVVMPVMGGPELRNRIVQILPDIKVLFMSGYADIAAGGNDSSALGDAFIEKPFTSDRITRKIRQLLEN